MQGALPAAALVRAPAFRRRVASTGDGVSGVRSGRYVPLARVSDGIYGR